MITISALTEVMIHILNTPGTAGGPGSRDRTLAIKKTEKRPEKKNFFS